MRRAALVLVVMLSMFGGAAGQIPVGSEAEPNGVASQTRDNFWRRTADGWQRAEWLPGAQPTPAPGPHPAIVGLFIALLSATVMVGLTRPKRRRL